ncbi:hypothetical protein GCM10010104_50690 [Streptomyces indiaensis]|uniref:Uncharacterized protein n=1 Tax=Streptomyces indiaensis TaxID=284033 RepID=A0ABP5R2V4_9ACTN
MRGPGASAKGAVGSHVVIYAVTAGLLPPPPVTFEAVGNRLRRLGVRVLSFDDVLRTACT